MAYPPYSEITTDIYVYDDYYETDSRSTEPAFGCRRLVVAERSLSLVKPRQ